MRLIRAAAAVLFAWLVVGFVGAGSAGAATQAIASPTVEPGVYRYDSSPTSTTHTANARDHALRGERRPVGAPWSLNLPSGNTAVGVNALMIPKGTEIFVGRVAGGARWAT